MHPKDIKIADYTYVLPEDKIAYYPLAERDASKLLLWNNGDIKDDVYSNIANHFDPGSLLLFNNTKVIQARILFISATGAKIELFCLEPYEAHGNYQAALEHTSPVVWKCMIGRADKWKTKFLERHLIINDKNILLSAQIIDKLPDCFLIKFAWSSTETLFADILTEAGDMPLPPYIKRRSDHGDVESYQTVFAKYDGSVAAPTASLHFTHDILQDLKNKKIDTDFVTLHVGAGTFKPVKSEYIGEHLMHAEWMSVSIHTIKNIIDHIDKNIVAVGTTPLRTIESLYWMGVKISNNPQIEDDDISIKQWEVYDELNYANIKSKEALEALLAWLTQNNKSDLICQTQIIIAPGYRFKIAKALVTNFHQPNSTLLLIIAASTKEWRKIYDHALNNYYRFLSYGDGCLINFDKVK